MSAIRRNMMRGASIDWESIARGMIDYVTLFNLPLSVMEVIFANKTWLENETFFGRTNLKSCEIPDNIRGMGGYVFNGCKGLTELRIPSSITSIGNYCFSGCTNLQSFICERTTPPTLGANAFNNTNSCPIYVPDESVAAYKAANNWSALASRIFPLSDLVGGVVNGLLISALMPRCERRAA